MKSKECLAMILAGGQGSRLGILTNKVAKPAVPFGGKYRIIDFTLSNCVHSGIDTVGVLTQYQPLELNTYIGSGQAWDLDRNNGGVFVLPPFMTAIKGEWYKGTANAIFQNIPFVEQFSPKYVVILSGDHIYKMNYAKMLDAHKKSEADATIAVIEVPIDEASRFGIMNTDSELKITEFEEKPENPKSNLASMGVYIFTWDVLKRFLIADENNKNSDNDFGKNIIPEMLKSSKSLYAHRFDGYWKDVGTIQSLYEANMEILEDNAPIHLADNSWKVFSRNPIKQPHYICDTATVRNAYITDGCSIAGRVEHSIIFEGVIIEEGAVVKDSIIFPGARVCKGATLNRTIIGADTTIGEGAHIGASSGEDVMDDFLNTKICSHDISIVGEDLYIAPNVKIGKNAMVDRDVRESNVADIKSKAANTEDSTTSREGAQVYA
ncbi:MAG: glucose-1-phosphate adenylyltransferase [Oscillospiraceae bacterium]|nr:glucose-1-phosphate adenylyltransferase [Oscillospiraceae bacterium]